MVQKETRKQRGEEEPQSARELVENLRGMIDEAEQMIVQTASHRMDETVDDLRLHLQEKLDQLKASYQQAEDRLVTTASATDRAIREKPYQSLGIAAGIGLIIGLWLNRKR